MIQNASKPKCSNCGYVGEMEMTDKHGCASISWIVCLTLFTGILFWIPLVRTTCKDKATVCPNCQNPIQIEYAECIWENLVKLIKLIDVLVFEEK